AYVALTRAVHATYVILSHGAKPDHQSVAGVMMATLSPDRREEGVLFELGDKNWHQQTQGDSPEPDPELGDFFLPVDDDLKPAKLVRDRRSGRGKPHASPSNLEGGTTIRLGDVFRQYDLREKLGQGRMMHGCLQLVRWLDEEVPDRAKLENHLLRLNPTDQDYDRLIAQFYEMVEKPNLKNLLTRSNYSESYLMEFSTDQVAIESNRLEVYRERPFAVELESGMVEGIIDRLVLVYQGSKMIAADIVDFKTDEVSGANLQERIEFYRPQLATYRAAISSLANLPLNRISTRLVFVRSDQIVNLEIAESSIGAPGKKGKRPHGRKPKRTEKPPKPTRSERAQSAKSGQDLQVEARLDPAEKKVDEKALEQAKEKAPPNKTKIPKPKGKVSDQSTEKRKKAIPKPPPAKRQQTLWD
ncbi:MAG: PD-(D/E)XK nuclease family protein, partial [Planctomycetota bacterium]